MNSSIFITFPNLESSPSFLFFCRSVELSQFPSNTDSIRSFLKDLRLPLLNFPSISELANYMQKNEVKFMNEPLRKWNMQEKIVFAWVVYYFSMVTAKEPKDLNKHDWRIIANLIFRDSIDCAFKFHALSTNNSQNVQWSSEESRVLLHIIGTKNSKSRKVPWSKVAREFYEKSNSPVFRNEKTIRSYWISHLDPERKKCSWMPNEDIVIINEYLLYGSQWSLICKKLNGRNVYDTKNRFNSLCKMNKIRRDGKDLQNQLIDLVNSINSACQPQIPNTNIFETFVIDSDDNSESGDEKLTQHSFEKLNSHSENSFHFQSNLNVPPFTLENKENHQNPYYDVDRFFAF